MAARARLIALNQPTYNLGAVGNAMTVVVDNGQDLKRELDTLTTILKSTIVEASRGGSARFRSVGVDRIGGNP